MRTALCAAAFVAVLAGSVAAQGLYGRDAKKQPGSPSWLKELAALPPEETYISDPPGGRVPYQPWALALRNEIRAGLARGWPGEKTRLHTDPQTFCLYSVPRATTRGGFEFIVAANTIDYEVTIGDPTVYARPWKMRIPLRRGRTEENWENACYEGNHDAVVARELGFTWVSGVTAPR